MNWIILAAALAAQPQQVPKEFPTDPAAGLVQEWSRAKLGTLEYIDAMPDIAFKPVPEVRSFAEQFIHVAGANYMFGSIAMGRKNPMEDAEKLTEPKESKAKLREFVAASYDYLIEAAKSSDKAKLDQPVEFFKMKMPRSVLFQKALEHHAHHRGQTTVYFRLKGVTPPSERLF